MVAQLSEQAKNPNSMILSRKLIKAVPPGSDTLQAILMLVVLASFLLMNW